MTDRIAWSARLRRWRCWLLVVGALVCVRAALPYVLRSVLASQASKALSAQVDVGDVDLSLLRGGIALSDVAVRPLEDAGAQGGSLPEEAGGPPASEPGPAPGGPSSPEQEPLIAWKRLAVELHWLPLFQKTVRLRQVELDTPYVALDRLEDGALNLSALLPAGPAEPVAEPEPESAAAEPGWDFGIDRFVLRSGSVRFRDLMIREAEPVELSLDAIEVEEIGIQSGLYAEPARVHVDLKTDEGTVRLDASLALREKGVAIEADVAVDGLSLRPGRVYIPDVGWSGLRGRLDAALTYRFETDVEHRISGTVTVRDLNVKVPQIDTPALAWKRLEVRVDPVDLAAQRVNVVRVDLSGAAIPLRLQGGALLPLLAPVGKERSPAKEEPSNAVAGKDREPGASDQPWRWSVGSLEVKDAVVRLLGEAESLDVGVQAGASDLRGDGEQAGPVRLALAIKDGTVEVEGTLRLAPPGFGGTVRIDQLALPEPAVIAAALPPGLLQSGALSAELTAAVGSAATRPGDVEVSGTLSIAEPALAAEDPDEFAAAAGSIEASIKQIRIPGVLAAERPASTEPITIDLAELHIGALRAQITNTPDGVVLPAFGAASPAEEAPAPESAAPPPAAEPGVRVSVASARITDGRVGITDRSVTPYYVGEIAPLEVNLGGVRWPDLAIDRVRIDATTAHQGTIAVTGSLGPKGGALEVSGREVQLAPFSPYATKFSPFSVSSGSVTLSTTAAFGDGRYRTNSSITLHDLGLAGQAGESFFQQQFGIPLSVALALLRDVQGNIVLDLPVEADEKGASVGLFSVVSGALRRAIVNALASPLKLIGAVVRGGKVEEIAPPLIAFRPGRDEIAPAGAKRIKKLGKFLKSRPEIGLTLAAAPTKQDARWLREQDVRDALGESGGIFSDLRHLGQRGTRERIGAALEARARDEAGELNAEEAEILERWVEERPPVAPERLLALATARLARVESVLQERYETAAERITRRKPSGKVSGDVPAVRIAIGAAAGGT